MKHVQTIWKICVRNTEDEDYQLTDEEWVEEVYIGLSDERINLDKKIEGVIMLFADLGLWQGRRNAFQIFW